MPFLRFTRDRRGYEHFQLVQPGTNRRGTARPRILYWFRSPPNIRIGRTPFDDAARIALEKQHPDVAFDWTQILATPIPSGEAEHWRERRRQDRAARQSAIEEETAQEADRDEPDARDVDVSGAEADISMVAENVELAGT